MIIDQETLAEAAFQLLASSTERRYAREAARLAVKSGLTDDVRKDGDVRSRCLSRLVEVLSTVRSASTRPPEEFEAAILLSALARTPTDELIAQLKDAARRETNPSPWLRSLSARLLMFMPPAPGELDDIFNAAVGEILIPAPLDARDQEVEQAFPRTRAA